jgi:peptidoglycan/LPS O-acetylase OafA/YrhL
VSGTNSRHFAYIDSIRGYAVALVVLCHATYLMPNLPYPVHRLTVLGWHGVQLFFLASTVTLMMSYEHEVKRNSRADTIAFFVRRFFRIAPAYYASALFYAFYEPPPAGFSVGQGLASLTFVNAWTPHWMGVTKTDWNVVPGNWSVGIEFSFYALFPFIAPFISSLRRAVVLLAASLVVGAVINPWVWPSLQASLGEVPADNFLYYWFPSQFSVFSLGFCLHHVIKRGRDLDILQGRRADFVALLGLVLFASTAYLTLPKWPSWQDPVLPTFFYASLGLSVFVFALSRAPQGLFVNRVMGFLGRISFSAYLSHFAVLELIHRSDFLRKPLAVEGYTAIAGLLVLMLCVYPVVALISWTMYRAIEIPMINRGKALIARRRIALPRAAA